jgi:sugar lactone lactonase YvrE
MNNNQPSVLARAELLVHSGGELSEGPFWNTYKNELTYVNIPTGEVLFVDPSGNLARTASPAEAKVGTASIVGNTQGKRLLVVTNKGCFNLERKGGDGFSWKPTLHQLRLTIDGKVRPNDGKPGPDHKLYQGEAADDLKSPIGSFYQIDSRGGQKVIRTNVTISNGICWDSKRGKMYYIDSAHKVIYSYPFTTTLVEPAVAEVAVGLTDFLGPDCVLDGMEIDISGNIWVACWGKGCVLCVNPETQELLGIVEVPVPRPTSCCFGGKEFKEMFITSESLSGDPTDSGGVFRVDLSGIAQGQAPYELWA